MGLIDLVKRLGRPVMGCFPSGLSDDLIRRVRVAVLPVHWYPSLKPAADLSRRMKAVNPEITIVSGGFTAGAYPDEVLRVTKIDYVVRGDAELPFVRLMNALLDNKNPDRVPNLSWRGGATGLSYQVDEKTLAASDNRDISWFPDFEKIALSCQNLPDVSFLFPWVVVSRGCNFHCPECFASPRAQQFLAGRGMIRRPPEAVREDLEYWSNRADIRYAHFNSDFFSTMNASYPAQALDGRFDLKVYYEWYRVPKITEIDALRKVFASVILGMFHRPDAECAHVGETGLDRDFRKLVEAVRYCRGRARVLLYVTPGLVKDNPHYRGENRVLRRAGRVELKVFDESIIPPIAEQGEEARAAGFARLLDESRKEEGRLARQHRLLDYAMIRRPFLYAWLWKVSILRARWRIGLLHFYYHVVPRRKAVDRPG